MKVKFFLRQIIETFFIHKPSQGPCKVSPKIWAKSVLSIIGYKHPDKHPDTQPK